MSAPTRFAHGSDASAIRSRRGRRASTACTRTVRSPRCATRFRKGCRSRLQSAARARVSVPTLTVWSARFRRSIATALTRHGSALAIRFSSGRSRSPAPVARRAPARQGRQRALGPRRALGDEGCACAEACTATCRQVSFLIGTFGDELDPDSAAIRAFGAFSVPAPERGCSDYRCRVSRHKRPLRAEPGYHRARRRPRPR